MQQRALDMATDYKPDRDREKTRERVRLHREVKKAREKVETERATERANGLTIHKPRTPQDLKLLTSSKNGPSQHLSFPPAPYPGSPSSPTITFTTGRVMRSTIA